jgi:hypothetical protein
MCVQWQLFLETNRRVFEEVQVEDGISSAKFDFSYMGKEHVGFIHHGAQVYDGSQRYKVADGRGGSNSVSGCTFCKRCADICSAAAS